LNTVDESKCPNYEKLPISNLKAKARKKYSTSPPHQISIKGLKLLYLLVKLKEKLLHIAHSFSCIRFVDI